jgi:hypothetical protein
VYCPSCIIAFHPFFILFILDCLSNQRQDAAADLPHGSPGLKKRGFRIECVQVFKRHTIVVIKALVKPQAFADQITDAVDDGFCEFPGEPGVVQFFQIAAYRVVTHVFQVIKAAFPRVLFHRPLQVFAVVIRRLRYLKAVLQRMGYCAFISVRERPLPGDAPVFAVGIANVVDKADFHVLVGVVYDGCAGCTSEDAPPDHVPMPDLAASGKLRRLLVEKQGFRKGVLVHFSIEAEKRPPIVLAALNALRRVIRQGFQMGEPFPPRHLQEAPGHGCRCYCQG